MKKYLPLFVIAPLVLAACTPATSTTSGDRSMSSSVTTMMEESSSAMMIEESSSAAMMKQSSEAMMTSSAAMSKPDQASARVIDLTVDNFAFMPSSISLKKGEKVTLRLKGAAGIHGLAIPDLGVSVKVEPGATVDVVLNTDTAGTFSFFCNIPCGSGHKDMRGTITII